MSSSFKKFLAAIVFLTVALCAMIASQEYVLKTGQKVILKTVPVDPRDAFRGDYVILSYEISTQARKKIGTNSAYQAGDPVYIVLNTKTSPATVKWVKRDRPSQGLYLTGRIERVSNTSSPRISISTLSQYYVPEGQGRPLEDMRRGGLFVEVSVKDGEARILNLRDKDMKIIDVSKLQAE